MPIQIDSLRFIDGSDMRTYRVRCEAGVSFRPGEVRHLVRTADHEASLFAAERPEAQPVRIVGSSTPWHIMDSGITFYVERVK